MIGTLAGMAGGFLAHSYHFGGVPLFYVCLPAFR